MGREIESFERLPVQTTAEIPCTNFHCVPAFKSSLQWCLALDCSCIFSVIRLQPRPSFVGEFRESLILNFSRNLGREFQVSSSRFEVKNFGRVDPVLRPRISDVRRPEQRPRILCMNRPRTCHCQQSFWRPLQWF